MPISNTAPYFRRDEDRAQELRKWAQQDINFWSTRNDRFQKEQDVFQMKKTESLSEKNANDVVLLNDPRLLVMKIARLIARHPPKIEVPPSPRVRDTSISQRVKNLLYQWDQAQNQKWMMSLNNPYRFDQAFSAVLRGWITERTMLFPQGLPQLQDDPAAIWDHQVIDPALVYPYVSGNQIIRVTHSYRTTAGELKFDPVVYGNKTPEWLADIEETRVITCTAVYWRSGEGTWYHGIMANESAAGSASASGESEWLKAPVELGYNPWTILTANGVAYRSTPWDWEEYIPQIGTGVLSDGLETYTYLNRMATKLNELLSLEANPPVALYTADGQIKQVDLRPGGRNFLTNASDKIELLRTGPRVDSYQLLWEILQKRADRAGLPSAFFAEYGGESGFSAAVLMAAGKDILFPYTEAINQADALKYRKVLELYRDLGPAVPLDTFVEDSNGKTVSSAQVDWWDIKQQGTFVKISREDMTPQEMASRINLGLAMLSKQAISLETFRRDWAKMDNPKSENRQVLSEQVYMNPEVIKALIPAALAESGQDALAKIWEVIQNSPMPQVPGQGQPPGTPGEPQLPTQTLPPTAPGIPPQMQNRMDPNAPQNPLLDLLQGGAIGGAGGGGVPPPPGSTGFVPQLRPSFR